jgi:hypothetical protein
VTDDIDNLLTKWMPAIEKAVTEGLKADPPIDRFLVVSALTDPLPYQARISWVTQELPASRVVQGQPGRTSFQRCIVNIQGAKELAVTVDVALSDMRDNRDSVVETVGGFARQARQVERNTVLWLVADTADEEGTYSLDSVQQRATSLGGCCRLIGSGDIPERAKKEGIIDDFVNPMGGLPEGVRAMLVRLGGGPKMRRVVDDLTLTLHRTSDASVRLRLSERFFVEGAGAVKFCGAG